MSIRYYDKEIVHYLSLLGAVVAACIGVFFVVNASRQSHFILSRQKEVIDSTAPLMRFDGSVFTKEQLAATAGVVAQIKDEILRTEKQTNELQEGFWIKLPKWGLIGLCIMAAAGAWLAGYGAVWITAWLGSLCIYQFIRLLYKIIRLVAPNCPASVIHSCQIGRDYSGQRDNTRILPVLIKITILLILALCLLSVVVWNLTAMKTGF